MPSRALTDLEKQFVDEAKAGWFGVGFDDDGAPFAHGSEGTGNLFSMEVLSFEEAAVPGTWCYFLPDNERLRGLLPPASYRASFK